MIICVLCGDRIGDTDIRTPLIQVRIADGTEGWMDPAVLTIPGAGQTIVARGLAHTAEWIEDVREAKRRAA